MKRPTKWTSLSRKSIYGQVYRLQLVVMVVGSTGLLISGTMQGKESFSVAHLCHCHFALAYWLCGSQFPHHSSRQIWAGYSSCIRLVKFFFFITKSATLQIQSQVKCNADWPLETHGLNRREAAMTRSTSVQVPVIKAARSRRYWLNNSVQNSPLKTDYQSFANLFCCHL